MLAIHILVVTMLQKMIDIVVDEARNIDMIFDASKSAVIRIGKNYKHPCALLQLAGESLCYDVKAKCLGMSIVSALEFQISIHEAKRKFFRCFNGIYHKCHRANPETVIMQLLNAYAKPLLLYGLEAVNLNERTLTRIITAWNSVIRKVFNIKYEDVGSVSAFIEDKSLKDVIMCHQVRLLRTVTCW